MKAGNAKLSSLEIFGFCPAIQKPVTEGNIKVRHLLWWKKVKIHKIRDFPGGPAVRTLHPQCRVPGI